MLDKKKTIVIGVSAIVLIGFVLSFGANIYVGRYLANELLEEYGKQQTIAADDVAQNIEESLVSVQEKLRLIADSPEMKNGTAAVCAQKLESALAIMDTKIGNLGRVDGNGVFRCSVNKALVGMKAEKLGSYITDIFSDPEHKPVMSRAFVPPGTTSYIVAIHVPVLDAKGAFIGTLGGAVYLDDIQKKYLRNVRVGESGFVGLQDDNGDILYSRTTRLIGKNVNDPEVKSGLGNSEAFYNAIQAAREGKRGHVRYSYQGSERITAYRAAEILPGRRWVVLVTVPVADAMKTLEDVGIRQAFWGFSGITFLSILVVGVLMLVNLFRSLQLRRQKDEFVALLEQEKAGVERKVAERTREFSEAQAQLVSSVRSLPFGFAVIDRQGDVMFANAELGKFVDKKVPDVSVRLKGFLKKINPDLAPTIDLIACIEQARDKHHTLERHVQIGPRFFRFVFRPVMGQAKDTAREVLGVIMIVEDTTEAKALERSRDEFFSIASHELRTPLTAIMGNTDIMLSYFANQVKDPEVHGMVEDMHAASVRLIEIVNDFLDMSRLEQKEMVLMPAPVDVSALIKSIGDKYAPEAARRHIELMAPLSQALPTIMTDEKQVRQILNKLVMNALEAAENGQVMLGVDVEKSCMKISVSDNGKGIALDRQHLLFRKFQQASSNILTRDSTHSTGLGLYISRLRAEGLGGKLYLEKSEQGKGSVFVLELPLKVS